MNNNNPQQHPPSTPTLHTSTSTSTINIHINNQHPHPHQQSTSTSTSTINININNQHQLWSLYRLQFVPSRSQFCCTLRQITRLPCECRFCIPPRRFSFTCVLFGEGRALRKGGLGRCPHVSARTLVGAGRTQRIMIRERETSHITLRMGLLRKQVTLHEELHK